MLVTRGRVASLKSTPDTTSLMQCKGLSMKERKSVTRETAPDQPHNPDRRPDCSPPMGPFVCHTGIRSAGRDGSAPLELPSACRHGSRGGSQRCSPAIARPVIYSGIGIPARLRTVGARSSKETSSLVITPSPQGDKWAYRSGNHTRNEARYPNPMALHLPLGMPSP